MNKILALSAFAVAIIACYAQQEAAPGSPERTA